MGRALLFRLLNQSWYVPIPPYPLPMHPHPPLHPHSPFLPPPLTPPLPLPSHQLAPLPLLTPPAIRPPCSRLLPSNLRPLRLRAEQASRLTDQRPQHPLGHRARGRPDHLLA
jgi:hypothetical protein